jgi:hypothetical protein
MNRRKFFAMASVPAVTPLPRIASDRARWRNTKDRWELLDPNGDLLGIVSHPTQYGFHVAATTREPAVCRYDFRDCREAKRWLVKQIWYPGCKPPLEGI